MNTKRYYQGGSRWVEHRIFLTSRGTLGATQTIEYWTRPGPVYLQRTGPLFYESGCEFSPLFLAPQVWTPEESALFDRWRAKGGRY